MLYNVVMMGFPLSLHIFIWTPPICFSVKKIHLKLQWIYLFTTVSLVKNLNLQFHVMSWSWVYNPMISCDLSPKYIPGLSTLEDIRSIDAFIFCALFHYALFSDSLSIFVDLYAQVFNLLCSSELSFPKLPVSENLPSVFSARYAIM